MSKKHKAAAQSRREIKNLILQSLSEEDFARLSPDLEPVELPLGQVIYRAEQPIEYFYFPESSMISVVAATPEGQCAEVGVVGREGIIGMDALLGGDVSLYENVVQHADGATRVKTAALLAEFNRGGALHDSLLGFARLMLAQVSQTALCNRLHSVEQRLARWLLVCTDRTGTHRLQLTQEFLAIMLGANRPTVTVAAAALQDAGYIRYSRGKITVIDRDGLENFTCACYRAVKKQYDKFI